jgi:hypothetical protein
MNEPEPGTDAYYALRARVVPTPKFGAKVHNKFATGGNHPRAFGYFVRTGSSKSGRFSRSKWWELTDGLGAFWKVTPDAEHLMRQDDFPHLTVDRSTEMAPLGAAAVCERAS